MKREISKTIEEFNKYRSPEAISELKSAGQDSFKVHFTGHFCRTCGFYDYFDDFVLLLKDAGLKVKIDKVKEFDDGAEVIFKRDS